MRHVLLLIIVAMVTPAQVVVEGVNCSAVWSGTVTTNKQLPVEFSFNTLAPFGSGDGGYYVFPEIRNTATVWDTVFFNASMAYIAERATRGKWENELRYAVVVEYWRPEPWNLTRYKCTAVLRYGNTSWTEERYYWLVNGEPSRETQTLLFIIHQDEVSKAETRHLAASIRPDRYSNWYSPLCSHLPDVSAWPNCRQFTGENIATSGSSPVQWKALEINGKTPGSTASMYGVNATAPTPWHYTDSSLKIGGDYPRNTATVVTDIAAVYIGDVSSLPFSSFVKIEVLAVPVKWGWVELRPPKPIPLYISRVIQIQLPLYASPYDPRSTPQSTSFALNPPQTFLVDLVGNATWVGSSWTWNWTLAAVAYKTPFLLMPYIALFVDLRRGVWDGRYANLTMMGKDPVRLYMPLGSLSFLYATVLWRLDMENRSVWVGSFPATYLRAVDQNGVLLTDHYEEAGARGKLTYEIGVEPPATAPSTKEVKWMGFAAAVDESLRDVVTAWYAPPDPCKQWPTRFFHCVYSQHVFTKVNGTWTGNSRIGEPGRQWPWNKLSLVDWMTVKTYDVCKGAVDFMHVTAGDPTLFYWHVYRLRTYAFNPNTGDWDMPGECNSAVPHEVSMLGTVYGTSQYRNTTRDAHGDYRLYQQTAQGNFFNYYFDAVGGGEKPAGWTDALPLGVSSLVSNSTASWALFLVPTTACNSLICTEFRPTLWGPAPSPIADLALGGAGYSFLLLYLNKTKTSTVRIYVEMGYVVERTRDGVRHRWVRNYLLAEVRRVWRPLDAVYVGPGWHVDHQPLSACQPLELGVEAIYVTPLNWRGPIQVVVEEDGKRYFFAFFVSNAVSYRISTDTPAPTRLTAPLLNTTVLLYLSGVPYFHGINAFGEGGRQSQFTCTLAPVSASSLLGGFDSAAQLKTAGDFWGEIELFGALSVRPLFSRPLLELVDPRRGLVGITAEGPVRGFAFYQMGNGTWWKITEVGGRCVIINASMIFPWDPVLILPLVGQDLTARPGDAVTLWRPTTAMVYKTWADAVGYLKEAKSRLKVVGTC